MVAAEDCLVLVEDAIGKENENESQRTGLSSKLCHCIIVYSLGCVTELSEPLFIPLYNERIG